MAVLLDEAIGSPIATRDITIDFLYLDLGSCTRCQGTGANLHAALSEAEDILAEAGIRAVVRATHVTSLDQAQALGFVSSPTIRINHRDIALDLRESPCDDCSEARDSEGSVNCRVWLWLGQEYTVAPKAMIVNAILNEIDRGASQSNRPAFIASPVSANLEQYFSARDQAQATSGTCCPPTEQATCCEPTQKASCCGEATGNGCGCR